MNREDCPHTVIVDGTCLGCGDDSFPDEPGHDGLTLIGSGLASVPRYCPCPDGQRRKVLEGEGKNPDAQPWHDMWKACCVRGVPRAPSGGLLTQTWTIAPPAPPAPPASWLDGGAAPDPGLLEIAQALHMAHTGSADPLPVEDHRRYVEGVRRRLAEWRERDNPWTLYDEAVRHLLRCVLEEQGELSPDGLLPGLYP
jgi:hypothetical protein